MMTYEPLVSYDNQTNELVCQLADSYEIVDASTITFHLREGVTFSNGDPLTGDDVIFSWQRAAQSVINMALASNIDFDNCVVDGQDLTIKLINPNPEFIYAVTGLGFYIVDKSYVESVGEDTFKLEPVGTGPYVLETFTSGETVDYVRNENYWGGTPSYAKVSLKPVLEEATRSIAFESGSYDLALITTNDSIASLSGRESEGINVISTAGSTMYYVNLWDQSEVFDDVNARLAMAHAVDWVNLCANIWGDYATPMDSCLTTASPDKVSIGVYEYDQELAKQYLAAAGYPDGFEFSIAVSSSGNDLAICEVIQAYLAEVGITLKIDTMDNQLARQASADGSHEMSIGQNSSTAPVVGMILSGQAAGSNSLLQEVHTDYEAGVEFQDLLTAINQETDAAKKSELTAEMQQLCYDECLFIPIAQVDNVWVYYDYVPNVTKMVEHAGFSMGLDIRDLYL
jgi:peptide/nickel transport system substrate-binding protein